MYIEGEQNCIHTRGVTKCIYTVYRDGGKASKCRATAVRKHSASSPVQPLHSSPSQEVAEWRRQSQRHSQCCGHVAWLWKQPAYSMSKVRGSDQNHHNRYLQTKHMRESNGFSLCSCATTLLTVRLLLCSMGPASDAAKFGLASMCKCLSKSWQSSSLVS